MSEQDQDKKPTILELSKVQVARHYRVGLWEKGLRVLRRGLFKLSLEERVDTILEGIFDVEERNDPPAENWADRKAYYQVGRALRDRAYWAGNDPIMPYLSQVFGPVYLKETALLLGHFAKRPFDQCHLMAELLEEADFDTARTFVDHYPKATGLITATEGSAYLPLLAEDRLCIGQFVKSKLMQEGDQALQELQQAADQSDYASYSVEGRKNMLMMGLRLPPLNAASPASPDVSSEQKSAKRPKKKLPPPSPS